jgi:hypothetical protein
MEIQQRERASTIVDEILSLHRRVEIVIERLKTKLDKVSESLDQSNFYGSPDYWRLCAFKDGMIKVRLILEQNFRVIETFGILASAVTFSNS